MIRIKTSQLESLAKHIFKRLQSKNLGSFAIGEEAVVRTIAEVFRKNFEEEERLNLEAKKLLEKNKGKIGLQIDEEKAFSLIKKQLAKEKNFVL